MKNKILCILFTLLFLSASAYAVDPPEMEWHKGYGTTYGNHVHEGFQTSDGGYIGIGQTWDSSDAQEMLVVKTDSNGELDWQKIVGTSSQPDIGICVAEVSDGFICGGGLYSDGNMKPGLVKLNKSTGNIVSGWPKYYSGSQNCCIRGIDILSDGSIVATGYKDAPEAGFLFICDDGTGFIMKTDSSGNQIWSKDLSVPQGTKVREISDGFAVASCAWFYDGSDHMDGVLIKTDSSGNETNLYRYGGLGTGDLLYDFDLTSDGGYILGGHTVSYGAVSWDYWLVKVNSNFVEEWHKIFGQPRGYDPQYIHDEGYGVRQTPDGGYILAGGSGDEYSYSDCSHPAGCSDEWKAYLVKTDSSGNVEWEGVYPGADQGNTASEYVGLTSDGGYISFNDTDSFWGTVGSNAFGFMKIASDGPPDTDPPTPDPPLWDTTPYPIDETSISMVATTGDDPSGVEYYFGCTFGAGHDSGWQNGPTYTDTDLLPNTLYEYSIQTRDKTTTQNETGWSEPSSAYTFSRPDINNDNIVDFNDFAAFALQWPNTNCGHCNGADFTHDSNVDSNDLDIFTDNWLRDYTLLGHWKLDNDANDYSGYDNDGILINDPIWVDGRVGNHALAFDGDDSYIDLGSASTLKPELPVTLCAWLRHNDIIGSQSVIRLDDQSSGYYGIWAQVNEGEVAVAYGDGGGTGPAHRRTKKLTTTLAVDTWYHLAAVVRGQDDITIYIDGLDAGGEYSGSGSALMYSTNSSVIGTKLGPSNTFYGHIDDVRVYNRALSEDEIEELAGM